ncbi:Fic family protein [Rhodopseudomonas sp. WA056]|uniref:Fic family protein n=1 Tax=Rhodopseudomonas sp. WA056 TaxID=2269367 RepID=UPI0013E0B194|nr:Fic family protein [Rhodopseudomonas sp. WA056]NEW87090.1 Fic family protein [Rhodopseudomonas sp. WA056]
MDLGTYEFDEHGRRLFRPTTPPFPPLEDVHDVLEAANTSVREFDRRLTEWDRHGAVGRLFARLDAVHSSGAEGSTTTFTDLLEYESALRTAPDIDDATIVAACADGLNEEVAWTTPEELVLRLHQRLFEHHRNRMLAAGAGRLKTLANYTADPDLPGGMFGYTSPAALKSALEEWRDFTLATAPATPELLRQMLSHWMFEHIHPVADGNGRIGRLLVPILMRRKGQTSTACTFFGEAVHENKGLYIGMLKDARITGKTTNYARQMLGFIRTTASANIDRLDRLQSVEQEWRARFAKVRSDSVVHRMIAYAMIKPVFTINDAQNDLGVSFAAANGAARALSDEGLLTVPQDVKRNRLFYANDVLGLFDRFRPDSASNSAPE